MQERWYSDKRDLVKWGALFDIASKYGIRRIEQVAFRVPNDDKLFLLRDRRRVRLASVVWQHFRDLRRIERMSKRDKLKIKVYTALWHAQERSNYFHKLLAHIRAIRKRPLIVFLDPDTGIAPKRVGAEHVRPEELASVFKALRKGDWLTFYQHARHQRRWADLTMKSFAKAVSVRRNHLVTYRSATKDLARDVALFAARRLASA